MLAPVVPGLTDAEIEPILAAARDAGAMSASYIGLRLPREVSGMFQDWLAQHYPDRAAKVMGRVRELHGGQDYDADFSRRMKGRGVWAKLMASRFQLALARLGMDHRRPALRCDVFRSPAGEQLGFDL